MLNFVITPPSGMCFRLVSIHLLLSFEYKANISLNSGLEKSIDTFGLSGYPGICFAIILTKLGNGR